jgi:hypothetical protein
MFRFHVLSVTVEGTGDYGTALRIRVLQVSDSLPKAHFLVRCSAWWYQCTYLIQGTSSAVGLPLNTSRGGYAVLQ